MNYKKQVIERLRNLPGERAALENLPMQIKALEARFTALRAAKTDGDPVSGGTNHREDDMIDNIAEREERKADLAWVTAEVEVMERNLAALSPNERLTLERFYINDERYAAERVAAETGYERSQVYRIREAALENLARRLYGQVKI